MKPLLKKSTWLAFVVFTPVCGAASLGVSVSNSLQLDRASQTIEISAKDLAPLGAKSLNLVHVKDSAGKEVLCQAIDLDGDEMRDFDALIFQADFTAGETKNFTLSAGAKQVYKKEQYKAFGRFVRERFDDFTWENDLIAHRTYGKALETWKGEPLTSSTIDIWSKRTPRMVINDWYLSDDYHADHGEGADFYSAGTSRGCGGSGVWADEKLWVSKNFISSDVLANGPIRVLFELKYAPFPVGSAQVGETKRISLDAGQQFDRIESHLTFDKGGPLTAAAGLKKTSGEAVESNPAEGWMLKWEKMEKGAGNQGLAILAKPADLVKFNEDKLNQLALLKPDQDQVVTYWSGFCWDKAGSFTTAEAWKKHVAETAKSLTTPLEVKISPAP